MLASPRGQPLLQATALLPPWRPFTGGYLLDRMATKAWPWDSAGSPWQGLPTLQRPCGWTATFTLESQRPPAKQCLQRHQTGVPRLRVLLPCSLCPRALAPRERAHCSRPQECWAPRIHRLGLAYPLVAAGSTAGPDPRGPSLAVTLPGSKEKWGFMHQGEETESEWPKKMRNSLERNAPGRELKRHRNATQTPNPASGSGQ